MTKHLAIRLSLIISLLFNFAVAYSASINGKIKKVSKQDIQIGDDTFKVSEDGTFIYDKKIKNPALLDVVYGEMAWTVYVEPEATLEINISDSNLNNITYSGVLKSENACLLKISQMSEKANKYLKANWEELHIKSETDFVTVIDSLKQLYLICMVPAEIDGNRLTMDFIDRFGAYLDLNYNRFIVMYPERHYQYTGKEVALSPYVMDEIEKLNLDNKSLLDIEGYKKFVTALIDYKTGLELKSDSSSLNTEMLKTDAVFGLINEMFKQEELRDFWLSEYLIKHIQANGISSSEQFVDEFYAVCETKEYKRKVKAQLKE
ncbi:hypothetical protein [Chondrinema litorale]|uniref:hypothetical protein n=1 Tax=Chondrinema litorale TaxID=2994555 RepID=UPI0025428B94|nr:hypothetical protein [Chondrinema litorale]UZR99455.1 hypothetical protein OQ292_36920 [Chondrinema litorale]